jgi:hypothetical protein
MPIDSETSEFKLIPIYRISNLTSRGVLTTDDRKNAQRKYLN